MEKDYDSAVKKDYDSAVAGSESDDSDPESLSFGAETSGSAEIDKNAKMLPKISILRPSRPVCATKYKPYHLRCHICQGNFS